MATAPEAVLIGLPHTEHFTCLLFGMITPQFNCLVNAHFIKAESKTLKARPWFQNLHPVVRGRLLLSSTSF
jgi:hypothetical protein